VIVAGAVLVPLSEGLREGLGLDDGILVFDVLRGSPALDAGLREGDVIVSVNGRKVTSIGVLVAAIDDAIDREVELQVSRRNAKRTVRLRP
jgi:putative serine protease PepD